MKASGFFGHITFEFQYQVFQDLNPVVLHPYFENHANIPWRVFFWRDKNFRNLGLQGILLILADAILVNPCPSLYKSAVSLFITTEK